MARISKRLLFISVGSLIAFTVVFASFFVATQVLAQDGVEGGQSSSDLPPPVDQAFLDSPDPSEPQFDPGSENYTMSNLSVWQVSGSTFRPVSPSVDSEVYDNGGCIYASWGDRLVRFNTSLDLPQGATIKKLRMYYNDKSALDSSVWLSIYNPNGKEIQSWFLYSDGSGGEGYRDTGMLNHVVDYSSYSYVLRWTPTVIGETMQLCSVHVYYEPPPFGLAFLPTILK